MAELAFYLSLFFLSYTYLGYPLIVWIFGLLWPKTIIKGGDESPFVSIIIAAYNEEACIAETILNKLELDYPRKQLEIIVVSDGSTDNTDLCAKRFMEEGVVLLRQVERSGKTAALNLGVSKAKGDIIVFSDANSLYDLDALKALVRNFYDPSVGYVTGHMVYVHRDGTLIGDGCSAYMKYENLIRRFETRIGSIVGVDGGIDAIRKELYIPMQADQLPDFVLPLQVVQQGYRVVYEPSAVLKEETLQDFIDEYRMRVRVALRALWALYDMRVLLFLRRDFLYSFQIWSHKILRYLSFNFLFSAFLANLFLWPQALIYKFFFLAQCAFYLVAFVPFAVNNKTVQSKAFKFAHYFLLVNLAFAHATLQFFLGRKVVIWTPRKG